MMKKLLALLLLPGLSFAACFGVIRGFNQDQNGNAVISFEIDNGSQVYFIDDRVPFGASATQPGEFVAAQCNGLQSQNVGFSSATALGQIIPPFNGPGPAVNLFAVVESSWTATLRQYLPLLWAQQHGFITASDPTLAASSTTLNTLFTNNKSTFVAAGIVPQAP